MQYRLTELGLQELAVMNTAPPDPAEAGDETGQDVTS